jgi:homoserine kinase type II
MIVYSLWHVRTKDNGDDDEKSIGVYSTQDLAEATVERLREKEGFRDFPEGFQIFETVLDRSGWEEGFISADEALLHTCPAAIRSTGSRLIERLETAKIWYRINRVQETSADFLVIVPGEHWEIKIGADGSMAIEVFRSDGRMLDARALDDLIAKSDASDRG